MTGFMAWANNHAVTQFLVMAAEVDPLLVLLNYGGLGLGILLFISGQLHSKGEVQDLKDQRDKAIKAVEDIQRALLGQTFPTLGRMTNVLEATSERFERSPPTDQDLLREVLEELKKRNEHE